MQNLNWRDIHPYNGSQDAAFEELCAQLARAETPDEAEFVRKAAQDAGVECFCIHPDGSEWGWQAKYLDNLESSKWSQIDDSVRTALKKHPELVRYYVCVPLDRPDARVEGKTSALDRWGNHVRKWQRWACSRGMRVDFVWWGASELIERLSRPEHVGRMKFWFGVLQFDEDWFRRRFDEARKVAGPRYTPELHVDLPISSDLELFGRTEAAFDSIKSLARGIRSRLRSVRTQCAGSQKSKRHASLGVLLRAGEEVLSELSSVEQRPIGPYPFASIATRIEAAQSAAKKARDVQERLARKLDAQRQATKKQLDYYNNPFKNTAYSIIGLNHELSEALSKVRRADEVCNSDVLIVTGDAGTGKTHLLCDLANHRLATNAPTVLLLGQRFLGTDDPWQQALDHLDVHKASIEDLVGALESAAQMADCRALVLVDALNEGNGRLLWGTHLPAFIQHLKHSPWLGVALSVRTSYQDKIIPPQVRQESVSAVHSGFTEVEFEALQKFFQHFDIEFPSVPILSPEFQNPLFLKTICESLNGLGMTRLPTGFQGITQTFDLYLRSINVRLASSLDYDPSDNLVLEALENLADHTVTSGERWILRKDARHIVDAILPGRRFEDSLFNGLLSEGAIVQDMGWGGQCRTEEVVFLAYERFADHIVADLLIRNNVDDKDPSAAFKSGGGLAFLSDESRFVPSGLIEALCVQVPERTGQELFVLAPEMRKVPSLKYIVRSAFRESIVWRAIDAFTECTPVLLNEMIKSRSDWEDTLDVLLTVSTIDKHPFNAERLDRYLRSLSMADRDYRWSIYSHLNWRSERSLYRLVKWASEDWPKHDLADSTADLAAITLSWTLSSSDRFLRDRATKALISLLTGRFPAVRRLLRRFSNIDEDSADPYIAERLYAVAYGVAMRSHEVNAVECLAKVVYDLVFASGKPTAHILLRDYARGVIERAITLGTSHSFNEKLFRPPYHSEWPHIPTQSEFDRIVAAWDSPKQKRPPNRNPVIASMLPERGIADFATYVIGIRSGNPSWLSLPLDEPSWKSVNERTDQMVDRMDTKAKSTWNDLIARENDLRDLSIRSIRLTIDELDEIIAIAREAAGDQSLEEDDFDLGIIDSTDEDTEDEPPTYHELLRTDCELNTLLAEVEAAIHPELKPEFEEIVRQRKSGDREQEPRFDLTLVQHYIVGRVHDLGWTEDKFGDFDRQQFHTSGREADKVERIGKKYQWIAYHEILAYIADHFQYRDRYSQDGGDRVYAGPWQDNFRDIDPSCMIESTEGDSSTAWWHFDLHTDWRDNPEHAEWIAHQDDLPNLSDIVFTVRPGETAKWISLNSSFRWTQPTPAEYDTYDVPRRNISVLCMAYLVQSDDIDDLMEWSDGVDYYGRWMPENAGSYGIFLGEFGWSDAYRYFDLQSEDRVTPGRECPVEVQAFGAEYSAEAGFDCSIDEGYRLQLPHQQFIEAMELRWSGSGADFEDSSGEIVAMDPSAHGGGPSALLIREDVLREYLEKENLELVWVVYGEKFAVGGSQTGRLQEGLRLSGLFRLTDDGATGSIRVSD